jgi:SAM-dependent methyltransferase
MKNISDIKVIKQTDKSWYKKIWDLEIRDMSWIEQTVSQVDFLWDILQLSGKEKILDLACGFGRHSFELAKRGCSVVGVDITKAYIEEATRLSEVEKLKIEYICDDIRNINYKNEFDVVINMADGAIGYLENNNENLKIFSVIANALKPGGKSVIDICNAGYAKKHFPRRNWMLGENTISLSDFEWDSANSIMYYSGFDIKYGDIFKKPDTIYSNPTRLYDINELSEIYMDNKMKLVSIYGNYDKNQKVNDDIFQIEVLSIKE